MISRCGRINEGVGRLGQVLPGIRKTRRDNWAVRLRTSVCRPMCKRRHSLVWSYRCHERLGLVLARDSRRARVSALGFLVGQQPESRLHDVAIIEIPNTLYSFPLSAAHHVRVMFWYTTVVVCATSGLRLPRPTHSVILHPYIPSDLYAPASTAPPTPVSPRSSPLTADPLNLVLFRTSLQGAESRPRTLHTSQSRCGAKRRTPRNRSCGN
jgi:hypothetical protein